MHVDIVKTLRSALERAEELESIWEKVVVSKAPAPKFLILMTDDNQVVKQPLIEIKEGEDIQARVNEVIQDLIVDEEVDVDSETAGLLKAVEVQFIDNHFIHQHFSVTGF